MSFFDGILIAAVVNLSASFLFYSAQPTFERWRRDRPALLHATGPVLLLVAAVLLWVGLRLPFLRFKVWEIAIPFPHVQPTAFQTGNQPHALPLGLALTLSSALMLFAFGENALRFSVARRDAYERRRPRPRPELWALAAALGITLFKLATLPIGGGSNRAFLMYVLFTSVLALTVLLSALQVTKDRLHRQIGESAARLAGSEMQVALPHLKLVIVVATASAFAWFNLTLAFWT